MSFKGDTRPASNTWHPSINILLCFVHKKKRGIYNKLLKFCYYLELFKYLGILLDGNF